MIYFLIIIEIFIYLSIYSEENTSNCEIKKQYKNIYFTYLLIYSFIYHLFNFCFYLSLFFTCFIFIIYLFIIYLFIVKKTLQIVK